MSKIGIGSSTLAGAKECGAEAAKNALSQLGVKAKAAFVYTSAAFDIDLVLSGVSEAMPGIPKAGNTSYTGVVTNEGFVGPETSFCAVMAIGGDDITAGAAGFPKEGSARETGKKAALEAMKAAGKESAPDYFYMAASPGEEETYLKGISDVIGRKPVFGGSAADNAIAGEWKLYGPGPKAYGDGVAVIFFYGGEIANLFTGAYQETDDVGIITKVRDRRVLVEIDGVPALKKYASWVGVDPDTLMGMNLLSYTITSPLGVKDRIGDLTAIRHPMNGNDDYSMNIGADLAEKTAVIRMKGSVDELIKSAADTLKALRDGIDFEPSGYFLVHCGGRRAGIDSRVGEMAEAVKKASGNVPFLMEFTFGEYGFESDGNNTTGGLMLSYTAFK